MSESELVKSITDATFVQEIKEAGKPVLVDFFAVWCGPCQMAAPILDKLAEEFKDKVTFLKMNIDENQEMPSKYGVMSIPTVMMVEYKDDKVEVLETQTGFAGEAGYRSLIEKVIE